MPQFVRRFGDFGVGVCKCGHLQNDHSNLRTPLHDGHAWLDHQQGSCCAGMCECKRFTFQRWVTLEEVADMLIASRSLYV